MRSMVAGWSIFTEPTMAGKWLELLKEIAPRVARVAMLQTETPLVTLPPRGDPMAYPSST